jgi:hypothetical protein
MLRFIKYLRFKAMKRRFEILCTLPINGIEQYREVLLELEEIESFMKGYSNGV